MASPRLREYRLIAGLIRTDPRRALEQVRAAAQAISRRPPPVEQTALPIRLPFVPRPEPKARRQVPDCRTCPHKQRRKRTKPNWRATPYESPNERLMAALVAVVEASDLDHGEDLRAAWERFWTAVREHPRGRRE